MRRRSESGLAVGTITVREKLDRLQDLFSWLYDKTTDPMAIRRTFYPVLFRLTERALRRQDPKSLDRIVRLTQGWDLVEFRAELRKRIESLILAAQAGKLQVLPTLKRSFSSFDYSGKPCFGLALWPRWRQRYGGLIDVILLEAAEDLSGFQLDTIVRCGVCGALTIRQRARDKQYCSSACRWQAITEERRAARQAAKSVEKGK